MTTPSDSGNVESISATFARLERENADQLARLNALREQILGYARQLRLLPANRLQQWDDSVPEQVFGTVAGLIAQGRAYAHVAATQVTAADMLAASIGPIVRAAGDAAGDVAQLVNHPRSPAVYRALHADLVEVAARALAMIDAIEPNVQYSRAIVEAKRAALT